MKRNTIVFFTCLLLSCEQNPSIRNNDERGFRSNDPVEVKNPQTIVETIKNDYSKIELFILEDSIYMSFDSKNIYFKNLDEFEKYCQKNKAIIQKREFLIIMERSTNQNLVISFVNILRANEIENIAFVSRK